MAKYEKLKTLTVLYVEDDKDVRDEIEEMLSLKVDKLFVAVDGEDGFNKYNEHKPDVIITDIQMPKLTGMQMIEKIRENDKKIPIIITSAFNDSDFMKKAIDLQVDKYITKPIKMRQLLTTLDRAGEIIYQIEELKQKDIILKNREKSAALTELLENIAHHWRQPLSSISTELSGMQIKKACGELSDESFDNTCDSIQDKIQLFSKMIDKFSRFYKSSQEKELFNLKDIVIEYIELVKENFDELKIDINLQLDNIEFEVVKNDFIQVLIILLNNAKDILSNNLDENRHINIELKKLDDLNILKVIDNGGGVTKENINRIFEPYFTTKHKYTGTGLGLYVLNEIVENSLNGTVKVKNIDLEYKKQNFKGAKFIISF